MTITVGQRVKHAIDDVQRGELELAMEHACIAIDITAKRFYGATQSTRTLYKDLIDEFAWLIELMALGGINVNDSIFGNFPIPGNPEPKFKDIVYHTIRCNLVHDEGIPDKISFSEGNEMIFAPGILALPKKLIWGLVGIVVFCPANALEQTDPTYWLSIYENRLLINDFWGQAETAKRIYVNRKLPRVAISWPAQSET
jgi:hypothetical protein